MREARARTTRLRGQRPAVVTRDQELMRYERVLERLIAMERIREGELIPYVSATMPIPEDPDDISRSQYDAQKFHRVLGAALEEVCQGNIKRLIVSFPPRHGKACAHDTPVLTPAGWTTHGELRPGDSVFGPDGTPTRVLALSADVDVVVPVELTNGETIRCHPNHEWTVFDRGPRIMRTLETRELATQTIWSGGRARFQLPDIAPIQFQTPVVLPVHPYALGVWLGDGSAGSTRIAHALRDSETVEGVAACGYAISRQFMQPSTEVCYAAFAGTRNNGSPMQRGLKAIGVLFRKHVPELYLRANVEDRLQLLAGLIDTDGHVDVRTGRVRFSTCDPELRDGVVDLTTTLGFRPYVVEASPQVSSSGITGRKVVFQVGFQPTCQIPTRIPRKQVKVFATRRRVGIRSIGAPERAGARSIMVDREDGLYLVGRQLNPTHNTELASKRFISFFAGHNPGKSVIFGTYNDKFSQDIGRAVRDVIQHPATKQAFPELALKDDSAASDRLETTQGGVLAFVGRGGTTTGRGADLFVIDDPFKDSAEADSPTIRASAWTWFNRVAATRLMTDQGAIVIIGTRWHPDDLIGRLTDPLNDFYDPEEAKSWHMIELPALARDDDVLGRQPGEALWPSRFGVSFLHSIQRRDPRGFSALYQGRPNPDGGTFFEEAWLKTYEPNQLPGALRIYAASDHAVSLARGSDKTCLLAVGVDTEDTIWVLPDLIWRQMNAEYAVDNMLTMMRKHKPLLWWAERSHISKSIGPFLRKRMIEEQVFCTIVEVTPIADKQTRAQSIQGRMAMGKVRWPARAPWWPAARDELLRFPHDQHDDLVDAISYIGLGLTSQVAAPTFRAVRTNKEGTFGWLKEQRRAAEQAARASRNGGW